MENNFEDLKNKATEMSNNIENLKNIDPQAALNDLKDRALDVNAHVDTLKAKGNAMRDKVKELGMGGLAIIMLGILAQVLFPWWSAAIVAFIVGIFVADDAKRSYFYGFGAMFLLWSACAGIQSYLNGGLISGAMSDVFMGKLSGTQLIFFTGFIGGLVGGFAAMSGTLLRQLFRERVAN